MSHVTGGSSLMRCSGFLAPVESSASEKAQLFDAAKYGALLGK